MNFKWMRTVRLAFAALICMPGICAAAVGRAPGHFEVSPTGAATYSIPLRLPPGARGIEPKLALVYNSQSGTGPLGPGWSLSGLSSITRCAKTVAQDGAAARVFLYQGDGLCLDGNRLRLISGTYGLTGSVYQTEIANFSKIKANGTAGSMPASFEVWGKDGLIYEYGNSESSRVAATWGGTPYAWALNKVRDRQGNNMIYEYSQSNGSYRVSSIKYTQTPATGLAYPTTVSFTYATVGATDSISKYMAGANIRNVSQLSSIYVTSDSIATAKYQLGYGTSPTTLRARLTSITQCDAGAPQECLPPTNISYQNGEAGVAGPTTSAVSGTTSKANTVDLNGDAIADLVYSVPSGSSSVWYVKFGGASGFGAAVATGLTSPSYVLFGDFLGEGRISILAALSNVWRVVRWDGSAFTNTSTGLAVDAGGSSYVVSDASGDGRPDLISLRNGLIYLRLNTSTAATVSFASTQTSADPYPYQALQLWGDNDIPATSTRSFDFDGNGRGDIIAVMNDPITHYPAFHRIFASGTSFEVEQTSYGVGNFVMPMSFNNDRCTDVLSAGVLYISSCASGTVDQTLMHAGTALAVADWDADGRLDLWTSQNGSLIVYQSQGNALSTAISTGISVPGGTYQMADVNGDGLTDMLHSGSAGINYGLHRVGSDGGTMPDLAKSFTDGFGVNVTPTYISTALGNYTRFTNGAYPHPDYAGALHVVSQVTASNPDGVSAPYTTTFWYYGARVNMQGRGFEGFSQIRRTDQRTGVYQDDYFKREFPFTGMLLQADTFQPGGILMKHAVHSLASTTLDATQYNERYFRYVSQTDESVYEVGSPPNTNLITQKQVNATYDGYGNVTQLTTSLTDKDASSPWYTQTWTTQVNNTITNDSGTNWCLGRPTRTTARKTLPDATTQVRTVDSTIDYANCRSTQDTIEPDNPTLKVRLAYSYGTAQCGNPSAIQITGMKPDGITEMAPRTTTIGYGTHCAAPESITNPLAHITTRTWNYRYGVPLTETDPNGVVTSWEYDRFGRRTRENRPDGTKTEWSYSECNATNNYCGQGAADLKWERLTVLRNSAGGEVTRSSQLFDSFDRVRYSIDQLPSGANSLAFTTYDNLGRVATRSVPYTAAYNGKHRYGYDLAGRVISDQLLNAVDVVERQRTVEYAGRSTRTTDPRTFTTERWTDVTGNLRRVVDPAPGGMMQYVYDPFDNLVKVIDAAGNESITNYDLRGFKTGITDPDLGAWTFVSNSLGELTSQTDAKGQSVTYVYDALSRPTSRTEPEGTTVWTWGASAALKNIGRLQSVSSPGGYAESYVFDSLGRPQTVTYTQDATAYQYDYSYNNFGALDTLTFPTSTASYRLKLQYLYSSGTLSQIKDYNTGSAFWMLGATDERANPIDETFGNGVHQITGYDPLTGLMSYRTSGNGGSTTNLQNLSYEWDLNGNLTARFDHNQAGTCAGSALCEQFSYDAMNRLDYSTRNGDTNLDVTFDAIGNILTRSDVGSYTYDSIKKHAVTSAGTNTYAYDANGNRTSWNGATTSWYSYNLPQTISNGTYSSTFYYGADGNRWKQQATYNNGSETTLYVGGLLEKVTVSSGTAYRHYIPAGDNTIVYTRWSTGINPTYYVTTDHLGSSSAITDGSGALVVLESFAAYGARRGSNWTGPPSAPDLTAIANATRQGFTGHEMLDNLGLIHMNGRVYDPAIGRFLSGDPFMDFGTGGQATNRFAYVGNNPLTFTDPTGFESAGDYCDGYVFQSTVNGFNIINTNAGTNQSERLSVCFPDMFPVPPAFGDQPVYRQGGAGSRPPTPDYEGGAVGGGGAPYQLVVRPFNPAIAAKTGDYSDTIQLVARCGSDVVKAAQDISCDAIYETTIIEDVLTIAVPGIGGLRAGRGMSPLRSRLANEFRQQSKHIPGTPQAERVMSREGAVHLFLDKETLSAVEAAILERGIKTGVVRGSTRYGLRFTNPIGYRLAADGTRIPLYYGELKLSSDGLYHVIPRTGPATP